MATFIRNAWYAAGWSPEQGTEIFARTILDESIVFFRRNSGEWAGLANRCPHRFAPLEKGRVVGDAIQCGYHGLRFDGSGTCVRNPIGAGQIPRAAQIHSYPVAERHGLIWVWCGDPAGAETDLIPDFSIMDDPAWATAAGGYIRIEAGYQLVVDNLMDLTHIAFLHPAFGQEDMATPKIDLKEDDRQIRVDYWMPNIGTPPVWSETFGAATHIDHWLGMKLSAPSTMLLEIGGVHLGQPRAEGVTLYAVHVLTPETSTSVHYFYGSLAPVAGGGMAAAQGALAGQHHAFYEEDAPMLEACQKTIGNRDFWDLKPVLLGADAPAVRARRLIDRLSKQEQLAATAAQAAE